jgi:hypothetical protein
VEAILLDTIVENLRNYDGVLRDEGNEQTVPEANLETKERLELRPNPSTGAPIEAGKASDDKSAAKPLTREELMNALGGKRTMAADIEALRQKREEAKNTPIPPPAPPKA